MQGDNISQAIDAINKNEVVGIPTETVYGIGVNPNSKEAVEKLFELKERNDSNLSHYLFPHTHICNNLILLHKYLKL